MGKPITEKVTWVGKVDWELRTFHGEELSTWKGSSYNSYLIRDRRTALIDTVWKPFDEEFVDRLRQEINPAQIDFIIVNHGEIDHSGALPALMREMPNAPIYCTANAVKSLRGHYHEDWNFVPVKTGDTLELGETKLLFIEAPMLHWPDTMFTYMTGENILFSNDAFGQHYATESLFNDTADQTELFAEALKYYANILTPFSPLVTRKIQEFQKLGLPLHMICPSHGVVWRDKLGAIVEQYLIWADAYRENRIVIVYDTMWNATRRMAEAIAQGIGRADPSVKVTLLNAAREDKNDIITEIFRAKAVLLGSPTINNRYLHAIGGLIEMIRGLKFRGKKAAAFGSYGWSGEAVGLMTAALAEAGFEILGEGIRTLWAPDREALARAEAFGELVAAQTARER